MLARLALEHLLGALCPLVLHHSGEVAVRNPAPHEGVDVDLMEARRVERDPACLLDAQVAKRRAQRRLGERHGSTSALGVALMPPVLSTPADNQPKIKDFLANLVTRGVSKKAAARRQAGPRQGACGGLAP